MRKYVTGKLFSIVFPLLLMVFVLLFDTIALLQKAGFLMYKIEPKLPCRLLPCHDTWVFGIKVDKSKSKKLNTVAMTCMQKPMTGGLAHMHTHSSLLNDREIIPREMMYQLMIDALNTGLNMIMNHNPNRRLSQSLLPLNIVFLRSNVPDGQFPNLLSKEIKVIKDIFSRINEYCNEKSIDSVKSKFGHQFDAKLIPIIDKLQTIHHRSNHVKWNPGIVYSVVQDQCLDIFGKMSHGCRVETIVSKDPIVVIDDITSGQVNDFLMQLPKEQEDGKHISKTLRYVQLADEIQFESKIRNNSSHNGGSQYQLIKQNIHLSPELTSDYMQFLWSLHFAYSSNVPFTKGPPDYPAPISFASHFAEVSFVFL